VKLLLDVNVVLDVLLVRQPHFAASARVMDACERRKVSACLCATSMTTLYYLAAKGRNIATARRLLENLLRFCEVAEVNEAVVRNAFQMSWPDFEDAVLHESAAARQCDAIVSRDSDGFKRARLAVYKPEEVCALLGL
jgi:predicted nucleic acid-binding protein